MDQLIIHAFPRAAPSCCGGDATKRKAAMHTLRCPNPGIASSVAETVRKAVGIKQRKMLVLINPFGGGGKAPRVWRQLQPLLETAGLELEVTVTRAAGHAKQIAKELEIGKYDALISVSGDGLVNEIVNGLLSRDDGMEAMARTPIAVAPGGTGNGLFRSLCHFAGEAGDLVGAAFLIAKGVPSPLDLWSFVRPAEAGGDGGEGGGSAAAEEVLSWSFLSFMWGIISDVDLESEVCRCCGPLRLTMYGLLRIANARRYSGTFAYLDAASDEWVTIDSRQWLGIWACNVPYMTESDFAAPEAELDNGVLDILLLDGTSRFQALDVPRHRRGEAPQQQRAHARQGESVQVDARAAHATASGLARRRRRGHTVWCGRGQAAPACDARPTAGAADAFVARARAYDSCLLRVA